MDKIIGKIKDNKKYLILGLVLWIILIIVLVLPFTVAKEVATIRAVKQGKDFLSEFITVYGEAVGAPGSSIKYIFQGSVVGKFFSNLFVTTIIYLIIFIIGIIRSKPKHQYVGSEHGSSDWSEHGEQYKILSKNKGILLAENNYLPIDKIGNVNVLVVGRFWFW